MVVSDHVRHRVIQTIRFHRPKVVMTKKTFHQRASWIDVIAHQARIVQFHVINRYRQRVRAIRTKAHVTQVCRV